MSYPPGRRTSRLSAVARRLVVRAPRHGQAVSRPAAKLEGCDSAAGWALRRAPLRRPDEKLAVDIRRQPLDADQLTAELFESSSSRPKLSLMRRYEMPPSVTRHQRTSFNTRAKFTFSPPSPRRSRTADQIDYHGATVIPNAILPRSGSGARNLDRGGQSTVGLSNHCAFRRLRERFKRRPNRPASHKISMTDAPAWPIPFLHRFAFCPLFCRARERTGRETKLQVALVSGFRWFSCRQTVRIIDRELHLCVRATGTVVYPHLDNSKRCPDWRGMPPSEWSCRLGGGASSSRALRRRSDRAGLVGARVAQGPYDVARRASCAPLS